MSPSTQDRKFIAKLLQHLKTDDCGEQRTRRDIKIVGDAVNSWKPGGIASAFLKLSFKIESHETLAQESLAFSAIQEEFKCPRQVNTDNPKCQASQANNSSKSKKTLVGNFNPPRRFSPPKTFPKDSECTVSSGTRIPPLHSSDGTILGMFDKLSSTTSNNKPPSLFSSYSSRNVRSLNDNSNENNNGKILKNWMKKTDCELNVQQESEKPTSFKTAHEQLALNDRAQGIKRALPSATSNIHVSGLRKIGRFDVPCKNQPVEQKSEKPISDNPEVCQLMEDPIMKNIEPKMVETILNEVFDVGTVDWNDIAGLHNVKNTIREIIIYPLLRPDIFTGLRGPPKGILLFGPPGTGKTMIGRLISTQSKSSFFNISASSLTSKWIGDGEKMVRALFATARVKQPSVIFIDEIDSILTQRSESEHESSRRLKTEFLIQFDGCGTKSEDRILVVGVTNRPQELDEAARRRLTKRIYIPLPDTDARQQLVKCLLAKQIHELADEDFRKIANLTEGYSGADMATLCQEASYGPIRDIGVDIQHICADNVRPMKLKDFEVAIRHVKASVDQSDLILYEDWDNKFGCSTMKAS